MRRSPGSIAIERVKTFRPSGKDVAYLPLIGKQCIRVIVPDFA
jgi:hypothetical protein